MSRDPWIDVAQDCANRRPYVALEITIEVMILAKYGEVSGEELDRAKALALEWDRLLDLELRMWAASACARRMRGEDVATQYPATRASTVTGDIPF